MSMKIEIRNVSKIDAGEYLCGINTSKGFAESKREIVVLNKGTFYVNVSLKSLKIFNQNASKTVKPILEVLNNKAKKINEICTIKNVCIDTIIALKSLSDSGIADIGKLF